MLILLGSILSPASFSAQLINTLPSSVSDNWQICSQFKQQKTVCETGRLPLSNHSLDNQLLSQTFVNSLVISSLVKNETLGLWLELIDDVDEIYFNQILIGKTGHFLPDFESGFRTQRLYLIPNNIIRFNQSNSLKIKTFSSRNLNTIQVKPPVITRYLKSLDTIQKQDYILIIVATILCVLSIFQIFYFWIVQDKKVTIYFFSFLVCFAFVALVRSEIPFYLGLNLSSIFKLETLILNVGIISAALFTFCFFELELRRVFKNSLSLLGISSAIIILWPFAIDLRLMAEINYWLIILVCFFVFGCAQILSIRKQRKYAWLVSSIYFCGWLVLIYDALMQSSGLLEIDLAMNKQIMPVFSAFTGLIFTLMITHNYWLFFKGSTYDHLTGTLLRPAFFQRLSEEMLRCQRGKDSLLVAVIDVQQVSNISINFGHIAANHLLVTVSNSLTKVLRPFDLICRISDEQFCIVASIKNQKDANNCLKRIYEELIKIQQPLNQDVELFLDARVGGVIYNQEKHLAVSQLLQDANYALSKANNDESHYYLLIQSAINNH